MENSYKYFENKDCKYYPCHKGTQNINCLFCYCPLYNQVTCPGQYNHIDFNGIKIKECTNCTFPHKAENYDIIISLLSKK
ncbi:MAG: metal-binding protein [Lachnospiraceae bacterium]|nr:metal-binding protein [Lachnospiraceae bacterium]